MQPFSMTSPLSSGLYPYRDTPKPGESSEDDEAATDIDRRPMRVKVLYTFDDENKSNCLARLPSVVNIPTVQIDEGTQIGVIELKTCIQAIVSASPELVAKLGHDYTVYAYDFSEYETPLVGQGMLSWVLASASPTPNAPAHESKTMITGRVCKNILGLFSNGIKETLEVKLRLVPVPTCLQSEYIENMEKYRSLSKVMPADFDHSSWTTFLKENPNLGSETRNEGTMGLSAAADATQMTGGGGIESIHHFLTQGAGSVDTQGAQGILTNEHQSLITGPLGAQISRPQSAISVEDRRSPTCQENSLHSRPVSRTSMRSENQPMVHQSTVEETTMSERSLEEGPARKRARITQTGWRGKSNFGSNGESLRVVASTAASIRVHRPSPTYGAVTEVSLEPPPRAPTPRPGGLKRSLSASQPRMPSNSSLRHGSISSSTSGSASRYISPYANDDQLPDTMNEDDHIFSSGETPMEFPSSPPVIQYGNPSPAPSSPALPALLQTSDSGFVSDLNTDVDGDAELPKAQDKIGLIQNRQQPSHKSTYTPHVYKNLNQPWTAIMPGPAELLPRKIFLSGSLDSKEKNNAENKEENSTLESCTASITRKASARSPQESIPIKSNGATDKAHSSLDSTRDPQNAALESTNKNVTTPEISALSPRVLAQESALKSINATPSNLRRRAGTKPKRLPRSQTWSGENSQDMAPPTSDTNHDELPQQRLQQPRSGSGAKRSRTISNNLEESIAAGEMPRYCRNCGEIKTSTWRKAFTKVLEGTPNNIRLSGETGGVVGVEVVQAEDSDVNPKYRIFKKVLYPFEKDIGGFECLQLCNPCGLWFDKYGNMRPPARWEKKEPNPNKRRRVSNTKKKKTIQDDSQSEVHTELIEEATSSKENEKSASAEDILKDETQISQLVSVPCTSHSDESSQSRLDEEAAVGALRRAIKSSPAKFLGTEDSPIDLESSLTPKPTRRLLFPSPRKEGEVKSLSDGLGATSPSQRVQKDNFPAEERSGFLTMGKEENDKENCPPADVYDDLAHLFEDGELSLLQGTPKNSRRVLESLLKTPTSNRSQGRNPLTPRNPFGASASNLNATTPSRSSIRGGTLPPLTPFTAHLNMLLSEGMASSPSNAFDFSALPTMGQADLKGSNALLPSDDFWSTDLNTELALSSSSPNALFSLYEDPDTSTIAIWSEEDYFRKPGSPEKNNNAALEDSKLSYHDSEPSAKQNSPVERSTEGGREAWTGVEGNA